MCGRFTLTISMEAILERFDVLGEMPAPAVLLPRYNVAPGQEMPAVTGGDRRVLRSMTWGLTPPWATADRDSAARPLINIRSESLRDKPGFHQLLAGRRCLVPADGFYEWRRAACGARGAPFRFVLRSREPFAFAGLWQPERGADGTDGATFSLITTVANPVVHPVHDRMPVILPRDAEACWLAPEATRAELLSLLRPFPAEAMTAYAVTTQVNSPHHDSPACIAPVAGAGAPPADPQLLLPYE